MSNTANSSIAKVALAGVILAYSLPALSITTADVLGTWAGTWTFSDQSLEVPRPAYTRSASFELNSLDPVTGFYGKVLVDGAVPGYVTFLSVVNDLITIEVTHPALGVPYATGFFFGSLSNRSLAGDYDLRGNLYGQARWRGPISLAATVPEPDLAFLFLVGLAFIGLRRSVVDLAQTGGERLMTARLGAQH